MLCDGPSEEVMRREERIILPINLAYKHDFYSKDSVGRTFRVIDSPPASDAIITAVAVLQSLIIRLRNVEGQISSLLYCPA